MRTISDDLPQRNLRKEHYARQGFTSVSGSIMGETEKAYLVVVDNGDSNGTWFPKSQLFNVVHTNVDIAFDIPLWLAEKKNLV